MSKQNWIEIYKFHLFQVTFVTIKLNSLFQYFPSFNTSCSKISEILFPSQAFLVIKLVSWDQCFQTLFREIESYRVRGALLGLIQYRHTFYSYSLLGPFEREEKND